MHSSLSKISALAVLSLAAQLAAQAPVNDECATAIPVVLGANGPFTNTGATNSATAWTCAGTGGSDIWFTYVADCNANVIASLCGGDYDTAISVFDGGCAALNLLVCNDDSCGLQSEATWLATAGTTYYIRVGGFNGAQGNFPLQISCDFGFSMQGVAEATAGAGTLGTAGGVFSDGDFLRWNYTDSLGLFAGQFGGAVLNFGIAGSAPFGVTPAIPGFVQLWSGSAPAGFADVFGPFVVGGPDFSAQVPPGLFSNGDTVRIQGVVLDTVNNPGVLPVVPTSNTIEFAYNFLNTTCVAFEGFEGIPTGTGSFPAGWTDGGGTYQWTADDLGTSSLNTGPNAAAEGSIYMYCETSSPVVVGDTFILNSPSYSSAGISNLDFQLSRVGATIGTLDVNIVDTATMTATALTQYVGASTAEWTGESLPLTGLPANFMVQFVYSAGTSFTGDIAIDAFCLN